MLDALRWGVVMRRPAACRRAANLSAYSRLTYGPDAEVDETWGEWKAAS